MHLDTCWNLNDLNFNNFYWLKNFFTINFSLVIQHLYRRYEYESGRFVSSVDLTPGPSEVHSILAVDSLRGKVYYLATAPGEPSQRNLYSVPLDASQKPTCISCELLTPEGEYSKSRMSRIRSGRKGEEKGRNAMSIIFLIMLLMWWACTIRECDKLTYFTRTFGNIGIFYLKDLSWNIFRIHVFKENTET